MVDYPLLSRVLLLRKETDSSKKTAREKKIFKSMLDKKLMPKTTPSGASRLVPLGKGDKKDRHVATCPYKYETRLFWWFWNPARNGSQICFVFETEFLFQGWFFVEQDEKMLNQPDGGGVAEKHPGLEEKGLADEYPSYGDVHWISHPAVEAAGDENFGRVDGGGGAFAKGGEVPKTPQKPECAEHDEGDTYKIKGADVEEAVPFRAQNPAGNQDREKAGGDD